MKKNLIFLLTTSLWLVLASCSKSDMNTPPSLDEEQVYTVSLTLGGEIVVSQDPLTRGIPTDNLYGINVYYDKQKDGVTDDMYAHGLFDNTGDMHIQLLSGYKYTFECSMVKDGKKKLYYGQAYGYNFAGYSKPFLENGNKPMAISNKFLLNTVKMTDLADGRAHLAGITPSSTNAISHPKLDRYYGREENYVPQKGGSVNILLKRTVFGAKFIIKNMKEDGTLTASVNDWWDINTSVNDAGLAQLYSFNNLYDCWLSENRNETYSQIWPVKVNYSTSRGEAWKFSNNVNFKRNILTTVTIDVNLDHYLYLGGIGLTEEQLGPDNNIDLEINGDGIIDTPVEPKPEV